MKILVIGSGGREHALAWKLAQSPKVSQVFVAPGNGGTATEDGLVNVSLAAIPSLVEFARRDSDIAFTVVGPEAPLAEGVVKSTLALSRLLDSGVGDTVRVSLSDSPEQEIAAARAVLRHTGVRSLGVDLISCPTCGRTDFDVTGFLEEVGEFLSTLDKDVSIAVMGCPVNGPGEARSADLGITGSHGRAVIFKKGRIIRRVAADDAVEAFKEEAERL